MLRLCENQRNQAIGMLQAGAMVNDVAKHFGCSRQTILNLNTRIAIIGSIRDRPRPGQRVWRHKGTTVILRWRICVTDFYQQRQLLDNLG